jgi:hypothetical protein
MPYKTPSSESLEELATVIFGRTFNNTISKDLNECNEKHDIKKNILRTLNFLFFFQSGFVGRGPLLPGRSIINGEIDKLIDILKEDKERREGK